MGHIYLYTGSGGGKTTNALGLALRSVGHKKKVIIIQFLKWWKNIGECKIEKRLRPYYEIYQFGRPGWFKVNNKGSKTFRFGGKKFIVKNLEEFDKKLANEALEFAKKIMKEKKPHLLILDEINLALHWNLLNIDDVIDFLNKIPKRTNVILTGRYAPKELIDKSDFVNEIVEIKIPEKLPTTKGIQY
ncbi:MAG: cob(I)yrinic acid a,c-diamide adenosyltransferase [Candidatus Aenigmatarchaeota archaeon]